MRDFNQMLNDLKVYLSSNNNTSFREFLLLELSEQEFLFFKLMFDAVDIPQNYHDTQTDFFVWYTGCNFIEDDIESDRVYFEMTESFYSHLNIIAQIRMGFGRLEGNGKNIDSYDMVLFDRNRCGILNT